MRGPLLFIDIETIPSQLPWLRDELRANVKAPDTYKKPGSIDQWLKENRESKAEEAWLKTSFDGGLGQIVCVGWAWDDDLTKSVQVADLSQDAEKEMLQSLFSGWTSFASHTRGQRPVIVGQNHVAFDIPFIWKRCAVHGVRPPLWFPRNPKPWAESVVDTMLLWDANQRSGGSMDRLCKVLGIPGKDGMSGADVWPMVQAGKLDEVSDYCRQDVQRTRAIHRRLTFS